MTIEIRVIDAFHVRSAAAGSPRASPGSVIRHPRNYSFCYSCGVGEWEIYQTNEVADWMENLRHADPEAADRVEAAVDVLSE